MIVSRKRIFGSAVAITIAWAPACQSGPYEVEHRPDPELDDRASEPVELEFDPDSVVTLGGAVRGVDLFQRMTKTSNGMRVRLSDRGELVYVYLGPVVFLQRHGMSFPRNGHVEVTGSMVRPDGHRVLIATEVTRGTSSLRLRDARGRPLW